MAHARKGEQITFRLQHGHADLAGVQPWTFGRGNAADNVINYDVS